MKRRLLITSLLACSGLAMGGCDEAGDLTGPRDEAPLVLQFHTAANPMVAQLIAGGGNPKGAIHVGELHVWNDADYLHVRYVVTLAGWCIEETHLHVADHLEEIPQKNGNPRPGRFDYKQDHRPCVDTHVDYQIPLSWSTDTQLYIGAHASLRSSWHAAPASSRGRRFRHSNPSRSESAWSTGCEFPGKNWATCTIYDVQGEIRQEWPEGGTTTVAFEDWQWAQFGLADWDYNDWVADVRVLATYFGTTSARDLVRMDFTVIPQAKLAGFTHVMHLEEMTFQCDGTYELYRDGLLVDSGAYDDATGIDVVVVPNTSAPPNEAELVMHFDAPCDFDFSAYDPYASYHGEGLFFDPWLLVTNTSDVIDQGNVRMLSVPSDWQWPAEGEAVWLAYPKVSPPPDEMSGPVFTPYWWTP
ncbi:MAG: hypothetical protein JSV86_09740 [Gemmatimonadota bacterium]|nr:MAG: hypothetical protein JSV86_09740 [Gemmatimonadota bacterium]